MLYPPNIVTILSSTQNAVDVTFRKLFNHDFCPGTILVVDYTGRGAIVLSDYNKMSLLKKNIFWFDLNDRRHTMKLFQLNNSPHFIIVLKRVIRLITRLTNSKLSDSTVDWFVNTALRFSENGSVNLLTLLKLLSIPELKQNYIDSNIKQEEIVTLENVLRWTLKFPSIYAISDGINSINLENYFSNKTVIWVESLYEHLEQNEHWLISGFLDIIIENELKNYFCHNSDSKLDFTILYLYPPQKSFSEFPQWIKESSQNVRHISIHNFQSHSPLHKITNEWIKASENIWVVGKVNPIKRNIHKTWLNEAEMNQIESLEIGKVWIKSNKSGKAIIAQTRMFDNYVNLTYQIRAHTNRKMKMTAISQMSSEVDSVNSRSNGIVGLYKKLYDKEFLRQGWNRVKTGKKNSHGIDKVTIKNFGDNIEKELEEIQSELEERKYKCRPLRRVYLEKPEGGIREIGVACVRDRVIQTSCLILLEPFFEPNFSNYSFAYRPRRDAHHALSLVRSRIKTGFDWVVLADIKKCFDSIDHNVLLALIERKISDLDILNLIKHWLYVDVLEFNELLPTILGVPQGESLSPLLSNIYLDPLDKHLESLNYSFVRYADDIIIQTKWKEEAEKALLIMQNFLMEPLHLEIKPAKTYFTSLQNGFEFLGFEINKDTISIRDKKISLVSEELEKQIKTLGDKSSTLSDIAKCLLKINTMIRGFRNYFMLPEEPIIRNQLELLDDGIENLGKFHLPIEIKDDPAWICRERFNVSLNLNDIESYDDEILRKTKTEQEYPQENIYDFTSRDLVKNNFEEKESIIYEDLKETIEESNKNIRNTVFELNHRLYVMTHGSYLTEDGNDLIIKKNKTIIARYCLDKLGLVFLQGRGMNIAVNLQLKLAELGIPIVFAPTIGTPLAAVNPISSTKSYLRKLQIIRRDDSDIVSTGLNMLSAKVMNQASLLKYFSKYRRKKMSSLFIQIKSSADSIKEISEKIIQISSSREGMNLNIENIRAMAMGYEGHAASIYWQTIKKMVPVDFNFASRVTKGAKDIVNQCFNYVYGLLYGEVWRSIVKAELDPYFGLIHGSKRDGGSMVFDLIEEFRSPFADRIVISMFGRGFSPQINKEGLLNTHSKKLLVKCFSKRWNKKIKWRSLNLSPVQILDHQANSISKLFNKEGKYYPFKMIW